MEYTMPDARVWEGKAYEYIYPQPLPVVVFKKTRMYFYYFQTLI